MSAYKEWEELNDNQKKKISNNFIVKNPNAFKYEITSGGDVLLRKRKLVENLQKYLNKHQI